MRYVLATEPGARSCATEATSVRQVAAGLAGLGLVGGVGAVTYNDDGTAKVTISDKQGRTEPVKIEGDRGQNFSCPDGTEAKLEPIDIQAGRIKITLRRVHKSISAIEKRYPGREAPATSWTDTSA
jgi:hypothetical protein